MTEQEQRIWDAAFGAAFAWHRLNNGARVGDRGKGQTDEQCAYFASNVAERAVSAWRARKGDPYDRRTR